MAADGRHHLGGIARELLGVADLEQQRLERRRIGQEDQPRLHGRQLQVAPHDVERCRDRERVAADPLEVARRSRFQLIRGEHPWLPRSGRTRGRSQEEQHKESPAPHMVRRAGSNRSPGCYLGHWPERLERARMLQVSGGPGSHGKKRRESR
jgi:hypothetical protein